MSEPLTDADLEQAIACFVPEWFIERLDTKLGTAAVVPLLKNAATHGIATSVPGFPYSDGKNAEWWAFRADRDLKGFNVEVVHEYRDDRPEEVLRSGRIGWNQLANMATHAALNLKRRALDELQTRSEQLQLELDRTLAEFDKTPDGDESKPGIVQKLDGLHVELAEVERRASDAADAYIETERNVNAMSTTAQTTEGAERKPRGPLTLTRPVKNTLDGSTLVQAKRSQQVHVLPAGTTRTLCNIDTAKWSETTTHEDGKVNCPLCAKALKQADKDAKEAAADEAAAPAS